MQQRSVRAAEVVEPDAGVRRYQGNQRWRGFSRRDQVLCLAFAQPTFRESLRDIETCLRALRAFAA